MAYQVKPFSKRVVKAIWTTVLNVAVWIIAPYYLGTFLASVAPSTPLAIPTFVYEFGIIITVLEAAAVLTEGMAVSVPFVSATSLLMAYYLWLATEGGRIAVSAGGTNIVIGFQVLVYILMIPSLWGAIKAPMVYMVRRRAAQQAPPSAPP
ncbi:MAG: hypothetical protein OK404_02550 [Thaumarchaeota archaeon]|nr:hypothetical protein [Nitrososphaerota archaeon]